MLLLRYNALSVLRSACLFIFPAISSPRFMSSGLGSTGTGLKSWFRFALGLPDEEAELNGALLSVGGAVWFWGLPPTFPSSNTTLRFKEGQIITALLGRALR